MNKINETISIDLTEDDVDVEGKHHQVQLKSCNYINMYNSAETRVSQDIGPSHSASTALNSSTKQDSIELKRTVQGSVLSDTPKVSTVSFIENLQKENPRIETVFIDSDEADNAKEARSPSSSIKIHNMVVINSSEETSRNIEDGDLLNVGNIHKVTNNSKTTATIKTLPSILKKKRVPVTGKGSSPSRFNHFASKSNILALQNETANISSRKFLVIPKEVAPLLVNTHRPISLNIPGFGPLLIPKPSDIFVSQPVPAIVEINKSNQKQEVLLKNINERKYDPLSDSKYCWWYQKNRKIDLEGFTMIDRLGFYKAEQVRSKKCAAKYHDIFKRLQLSIRRKEDALAAVRSGRFKMENIKLVEIDSIRKRRKINLLHNTHQNHVKLKRSPSHMKQKEKKTVSPSIHCVPSIKLYSSESDNQISNDLLVTRKVVFINDDMHPMGKKRKKCKRHFSIQRRRNLQKSDKESLRSPGPYQVVFSDETEKTKSKKRGRPRKKENIMDKTSTTLSKSKKHVRPVTCTRRGQSSDLSVMDLSNVEDYDIKPCEVEIIHNNLVQEAVEKYNDYTFKSIRDLVNTCKIINDLKQFQSEIQPIKPMLVINEDHCSSVNFQEVSCKYNIVFPMLEITHLLNLKITNRLFVESAAKGYVKFVEPHILSRYLAGFREPL